MAHRPFRFDVVAAQARSGEEWSEQARRVEALGYATLVVPDNVEHTLAPLPALAAAAAVTRSLRVGTYVLANGYRNPVLLAKEGATLDLLSGGRFELGLGAGRPSADRDHRMLGIPFGSGGERVDRLAESVRIIKALLAGERVDAAGPHYTPLDAAVSPVPVQRPRPPLLLAGSGARLLSLAGREADSIALGVAPDATEDALLEKIAVVREAAGERFGEVELGINLVAVGDHVVRYVAMQFGADAETLARAGAVSALAGGADELCAQLLARRERLGLSYYLVSDELMVTLAPVVERLAGR